MPVRVVILGAGFGGLELSARLSAELAGEVQVTLIDQNDAFVFGFSKLDVMFGRRTSDEVRLHYRDITKPSVEMGSGAIGKVDVNFLSGPAPTAAFTPPSLAGADEKRLFAAARRRRWFGQD